MKSKTSHPFYQNRSNKIYQGVLIVSLFIQSAIAFSQGLYLSFEKLLNGQKSKYQTLSNSLVNQDFSIDEVDDIDSIKLDPEYLNLIIQNTPSRYILLASNDRCSLYDLMQTDLLKSPDGFVKNVIINYQDKQKKLQKRILVKEKFLNLIGHVQCPKVKEFKNHFSTTNARKTLQNIKLIPPTSKKECYDLFESFKSDVKSPYLCNIVEQLRSIKKNTTLLNNIDRTDYKARSTYQKKLTRAASFDKILSVPAKKMLTGLCLNLDSPQNYCSQYFTKSFWTENYALDSDSAILTSYCNGKNKNKCLNTLNSNPSFCHFAGQEYQALFPKPDCSNISRALLKSQTNKFASDCPARTGNDAITSFSRVLNHRKNQTSRDFSCQVNSSLAFAKFTQEADDFQSWQVNLCFLNKLDGNRKVCYPTLYDDLHKDELSLPIVVGKILARTKGFKDSKCEMTDLSDYKPALLKFRSGCHILYDKNKCTSTNCELKILLDEQDVSETILNEAVIDFNLFPIDFINENKSIIKIYAKNNKLDMKTIKNITSFLAVKKNHPFASFIGVGCREDLLPSFFQGTSLNTCNPLPFTVDGYFEDSGSYALVVRTALDQIHAPRIIPWTYIFNSVKSYQELHPIKLWGFYAIY